MIEHITQCMYNLCSPTWRLVTAVGYVFTDLRIYAPPSPSRRPSSRRASPNQITAGLGPRAQSQHSLFYLSWFTLPSLDVGSPVPNVSLARQLVFSSLPLFDWSLQHAVGGVVEEIGHVRTTGMAKTLTVSSIEELDTRSMSL